MAFPTTNATEELPAINQILASVGQAPVTTLDTTNPDVAIAYDTLLQVSREVQAEGWTFNKEYQYEIITDDNKEFTIPNNMLQIDLSDTSANRSKDVVRRDGKLYDRHNHKFEISDAAADTLKVDVTWQFDWVDLPVPIQDYITARATTFTASRIVGDNSLVQMCARKEQYCRASALEYDCNQGDYTFFGHPKGQNNYNGFQPYHALYR